MLQIEKREREGIEMLDLRGNLTLGAGNEVFRNEIDELLKAGKKFVILNFSDLDALDTAGLGTLLLAQANLRRAGGRLAIYSLKPSHIDMLTNAQLDTTFEVFPDEQDAVNSFFPDRKVRSVDILQFVKTLDRTPPVN
jgi:anti-sigma B factor antagonist